MDLEYFFAGTQSKEETSSAILATLLRHDDAFRTLFMSAVTSSPALDPSADWTIRVEDVRTGFRRFDVTLQADTTTVVIENKLAANARRAGQLLEYYSASREEWPTHRLVALYLAPEVSWGHQHVEDVRHADRRSKPDCRRGPRLDSGNVMDRDRGHDRQPPGTGLMVRHIWDRCNRGRHQVELPFAPIATGRPTSSSKPRRPGDRGALFVVERITRLARRPRSPASLRTRRDSGPMYLALPRVAW